MNWRTALYYTQLWLVIGLTSSLLTKENESKILSMHNSYRSLVSPEAGNMQRMLWDEGLSQVALNFTARCTWEHNSNIMSTLGENLFMTLGDLKIEQAMELWYNEYKDYHFENNTCAEGKMCGHYTQITWAKTTFVGCGATFCPFVPNFGVTNATILTCNYYPPGNVVGESPYVKGTPCSACPKDTFKCVAQSCDQGDGLTTGLTDAQLIGLMTNNTAGFTKPSSATFLLAGLTALYSRLT